MTISRELLDESLTGCERLEDLLGDAGLMEDLRIKLIYLAIRNFEKGGRNVREWYAPRNQVVSRKWWKFSGGVLRAD